MNILVIAIIIFVTSVAVIEMLLYGYRTICNPDRKKVRKRLRNLSAEGTEKQPLDILRKKILSDVPFLNKILLHTPGLHGLDRLLRQANVQWRLGVFLLLTIVLALTGFLVGSSVLRNHAISAAIAAITGSLPYFYVHLKKKMRMQKFQKQLPEALELIARSLKAGHAFPSGMKLAADEFDDPLGPEFDEVLNEINFGVSVPDALKNLANRVDCPDLRFFVVSVILQRETGGNLAEVIDNLAHIIRERFKLEGKIRVLSAEGRFSAIVLVAVPFVIMIVLRFVNPGWIETLFSDEVGRIVAVIAAFMMAIGIVVMKKMINIKV